MTPEGFFDQVASAEWSGTPGGLHAVALSLALAFVLGQVIGWVYIRTHQGVSYSRSFTVAMAALPMIVALVMLIMVDNIIVAFGLFAVFAIVRFRNIVKDTRDTSFVLWAIMTGMAIGTMRFSLAVVGAITLGLLFGWLHLVGYGNRERFDALLSLQLAGHPDPVTALGPVLRRHTLRAEVTSQRGDTEELAVQYNLEMRDPDRAEELIAELRGLDAVREASLFRREEEAEL